MHICCSYYQLKRTSLLLIWRQPTFSVSSKVQGRPGPGHPWHMVCCPWRTAKPGTLEVMVTDFVVLALHGNKVLPPSTRGHFLLVYSTVSMIITYWKHGPIDKIKNCKQYKKRLPERSQLCQTLMVFILKHFFPYCNHSLEAIGFSEYLTLLRPSCSCTVPCITLSSDCSRVCAVRCPVCVPALPLCHSVSSLGGAELMACCILSPSPSTKPCRRTMKSTTSAS